MVSSSSGYYKQDNKMSVSMSNGLAFKKRSAKIDWKKIASVDLDQVAKELDVYTLQQNIDHLTFCNIDSELDTRMMDPNYVKLFKMSQLTIEYLMHSQNYLTEVITTVESQLNKSSIEVDELKKNNEKVSHELVEVKKESKKRKKMIETQQALINTTSSNYHQAHITRRHSDVNPVGFKQQQQSNELERELEKIKERLRATENDLVYERNARLASNIAPVANASTQNDSILKQMEEMKNNETRRYKEELKKARENFKKELHEMNEKNANCEKLIKDLQERLGTKSHVGWIKDDIDVEKDTVLKQKQELERLNSLINDYETQIDDIKTKSKTKEVSIKKKHLKELNEKENEIASLKARLSEIQNSIGKSDDELRIRLEELQQRLHDEQKLRYDLDKELAELKNRPPPVTPRQQQQQQQQAQSSRTPSPSKQHVEATRSSPMNASQAYSIAEIYLPEYCRLTLKAVQKNPNQLVKFREAAIKYFNEELDQIGIDPNEKGLSAADFKQKMNELKSFRQDTMQELPMFKDIRQVFSEICDKFATQKFNSSLKSTGNRVTFKNDLVAAKLDLAAQSQVNKSKMIMSQPLKNSQRSVNSKSYNQSEETDDDVSLSNALESEDENDTEPTKSGMNETSQFSVSQKEPASQTNSPRKGKNSPRKSTTMYNQDEISDLESLSQLLSDRSNSRRRANLNQFTSQKPSPKISAKKPSPSNVSDKKKLIEKQLSESSKNAKPSPNAVPVGFQTTASRLASQAKHENSFSSISDLENEATQNQRPKSGFKSSLQDSQSSSIWVSENDTLQNNPQLNKANDNDRPATANSLKTSNYDSDEAYN